MFIASGLHVLCIKGRGEFIIYDAMNPYRPTIVILFCFPDNGEVNYLCVYTVYDFYDDF